MSVTLTTPPPALSFSADNITAHFTSLNHYEVVGEKSVSFLYLPSSIVNGTEFTFKYGSKDFKVTVKTTPDDSGLQIPAVYSGLNALEKAIALADALQTNGNLNDDFDIAANGPDVRFTAKVKGKGFDFAPIGGNAPSTSITGKADQLKANYSISLKLYIENETYTGFEQIYETQLQLINGTVGASEIQLSDKLHAAIEASLRKNFPDQPIDSYIECKKSCRRYYFEYAERYGESVQIKKVHRSGYYKVLHGGLSTRAQFNTTLISLIAPNTENNDRFLKQGSNHLYTRTNQPQYLYFYNTRNTRNGVTLKASVTYSDGETALFDLETFNLLEGSKLAFNVTFDKIKGLFEDKLITKYAVFLSHADSDISERRTYYLDYSDRNYIRYFLNWSSFGGYDTRVCFGEGESEFQLTNKTAERVRRKGDDIKHGNRLTFGSKLTRSFSVNTGWLSRYELQGNADFFLSNYKYRYTGGLMLPIEVSSGKISEITDGQNLYTQKIDYKYLSDDHAYTEGDAEDNGEIISGFFFSTPPIVTNPSGFTETDPTVPAWVKSITAADISKWNSAANPSDLSNFYNRTEIAALFNSSPSLPGYNKANWDNAFSWGNHAGLYQPKEDQRLSKNDIVTYKGVNATDILTIPTAAPLETEEGKTYLFGAPVAGTPPLVHVVARMGDLLNFSEAGRQDGYIVYWDETTFTYRLKENIGGVNPGDLTNYYTKSEIGSIFAGGMTVSGYNKTNWDKVNNGSTLTNSISGNAGSANALRGSDVGTTIPIRLGDYGTTLSQIFGYDGPRDRMQLFQLSHVANALSSLISTTYSTPDTIVRRTTAGYVFAKYYNNDNSDVVNSGMVYFTGETNDKYLYRFTPAAARIALGMPSGGETLQSVLDRDNIAVDRAIRLKGDSSAAILYIASNNTNILLTGAERTAFGGSSLDGIAYVYGDNKYHIAINGTKVVTIDSTGLIANGRNITALQFNGDLNGSANKWNGNTQDGGPYATPVYFMTAMYGGVWGYTTLSQLGASLNIGNGSTLNNGINGNAATVTNGVYTSGSYANPNWLASLAYSKLSGAPTLLSQFTNDLNLGSAYQPLENQRLGTTDNVTHASIKATNKLVIPSVEPTVAEGEVALYWGAVI